MVTAAVLALSGSATSQRSNTKAAPVGGSIAPDATALMIENFDYVPGQLTTVSGGSWVNFSGTANFIQVTAGGLSYSGYPSSGIGNKIDIVNGSAEDAYRQFVTQPVGTTTYAAFMVNVSSTTGMLPNTSTTGDYFAGFLPSNSTTLLNGRVSVRVGSVAGTYQLGLRATSSNTTSDFSTTDLNPGTTYLVVISYQSVAGGSNDVVKMWINPTLGGAEPAANLTQTTATVTDIIDVSRFFIRQGTNSPLASVDGIRVGNSWSSVTAAAFVPAASMDFNGDGKTDYSLTRDSLGSKNWWILQNTSGGIIGAQWGLATDSPAPADYDGDGKTDIAVWRSGLPNQAAFYIFQSGSSTVRVEVFGQAGDKSGVVADYDGDGIDDVAVYRPGLTPGAQSYFFYRGSLNNPAGNITYVPWGVSSDVETSGDFDGDGKADFCVRRDIGGAAFFILLKTTGGVEWINWGLPTDAIMPGDYDGDGRSDFCVARIAGAFGNFYILERDGGGTGASPIVFGDPNTDYLAQGDYDGDARTDIALWRENPDPTQNNFWVRLSGSGNLIVQEWGQQGDRPVGEWNVSGGN
jgi:hypothetical protein